MKRSLHDLVELALNCRCARTHALVLAHFGFETRSPMHACRFRTARRSTCRFEIQSSLACCRYRARAPRASAFSTAPAAASA
eukprot:2880214-Pleurochrysis_carterae.AAC.1